MSDAGRSGRGVQLRLALDVVATLAVVVASGALLWIVFMGSSPGSQVARSAPPVPKEPISLDGAPVLGSSTAPVVMLEFSDFECPFCAKFVKDIWPEIKVKYIDTGQLQLAFKHLPLPIHKHAQAAAANAVCAAEQQKFWPVHDQLFGSQGKLDDSDLAHYATGAGVEPKQFAACMAGRATTQVQQDADAAKNLKLTGTPSFLIGRRSASGRLAVAEVLLGARPLADFERAFGKVLKG